MIVLYSLLPLELILKCSFCLSVKRVKMEPFPVLKGEGFDRSLGVYENIKVGASGNEWDEWLWLYMKNRAGHMYTS